MIKQSSRPGGERQFFHFIFFCLLLHGWFVSIPAAYSQVTAALHPLARFETAFTTLANQERLTIVTEDSPLKLSLTTEQLQTLLSELQDKNTTERFTIIAKAYDYEATRNGNVLILKKQYTDINDLPFVSYEEATAALKHIERTLAPLDPPTPLLHRPQSAFFQFVYSLSDDQIALLTEKQPGKSLTDEQRMLLRQIGAKQYMTVFTLLQRIYTWYLKQLPHPDTNFQWVQVVPDTPQILILDGPLGLRGGRVQKGISHGFDFQSGGASGLNNPAAKAGLVSGYFIYNWDAVQTKMWKDALTGIPDITEPLPGATLPQRSTATLTLAQAIERLNTRTERRETYQIAPELASKPVCIFGLENSTPASILQSLADLYELDLVPVEEGIKLTLPIPPRTRGYDSVFPVIRRCFPAPYRRYYGTQFRAHMKLMEKPENQPMFARNANFNNAPRLYAERVFAGQAVLPLKNKIYDTTVRQMRIALDPQVAVAPDGKLPFSKASVDVQRFFTLLCLVDTFSQIDETAAPLTSITGFAESEFPAWYDHLETLAIQVQTDKARKGAILGIWDANGENRLMLFILGGAGPRYAPPPKQSKP